MPRAIRHDWSMPFRLKPITIEKSLRSVQSKSREESCVCTCCNHCSISLVCSLRNTPQRLLTGEARDSARAAATRLGRRGGVGRDLDARVCGSAAAVLRKLFRWKQKSDRVLAKRWRDHTSPSGTMPRSHCPPGGELLRNLFSMHAINLWTEAKAVCNSKTREAHNTSLSLSRAPGLVTSPVHVIESEMSTTKNKKADGVDCKVIITSVDWPSTFHLRSFCKLFATIV